MWEPDFITLCDGYKLDHRRQYPTGTTRVFANWTPRMSRIPDITQVVFFGLQMFLQKCMIESAEQTFFMCDKDEILRKYKALCEEYLGPNDIGVDHIADLHDLGYLPLEFRAREEGSLVNLRTPMLTVENTIDEFFWLPNWIETLMSAELWLPCTTATTAYRFRKMLDRWTEKQGADPSFVQWQGHDFSMRGMELSEGAIVSAMGHLTSFTGSDTFPAIDALKYYYYAEGLIAGSIAATEHSVMSAGTAEESEFETVKRILTELYPRGKVAIVGDTYNLWKFITEIVAALKDEIMARPDGKFVTRPDSGDPIKIIAGDNTAVDPDAREGVIRLLWEIFGGTTTPKGYKILDSHVGAIYGDSINYERGDGMAQALDDNGFSIANMVFGCGSYGYQMVTRDTFGFAMKATHCVINGVEYKIFKDPYTDQGSGTLKKSAIGRMVINKDGTMTDGMLYDEWSKTPSLLTPVWRDGNFIRETTLAEVRSRLHPEWVV